MKLYSNKQGRYYTMDCRFLVSILLKRFLYILFDMCTPTCHFQNFSKFYK